MPILIELADGDFVPRRPKPAPKKPPAHAAPPPPPPQQTHPPTRHPASDLIKPVPTRAAPKRPSADARAAHRTPVRTEATPAHPNAELARAAQRQARTVTTPTPAHLHTKPATAGARRARLETAPASHRIARTRAVVQVKPLGTTEHAFSAFELAVSARDVRRAGGVSRYAEKAAIHDRWVERVVRQLPPEADETTKLRAQMQFLADETAARPDLPLETIQRFAFEEPDALTQAGRILGGVGALLGIYSLYRQHHLRTTTDKINAAATVLSIGGGALDTALLIGLTIPGADVAVLVIGVGVGATQLGLLAAQVITHHEAQIKHGVDAAASFLQRNPEIAPELAAVAALASHRGNIVAAGRALETSLERQAGVALGEGERVYSAAVSVGGRVFHGAESLGSEAVHFGERLASDLIP